jgi:soluble lytic murein transglycosylase-like protein
MGCARVKFKITQFAQYLELALGVVVVASPQATAQIIAIGPEGQNAVYAGPVVSLPEGTRPLIPPAPTQRPEVSAPQPVRAAIEAAAGRHQLSPQLVEAVAWQESRFRQDAVSPKGARGIMQLMPATAAGLGMSGPADLTANLDGGTAYLAEMLRRFDGDIVKALAAYNSGPEAVARYGGVPPYLETRNYVDAILGRLAGPDTLPEISP